MFVMQDLFIGHDMRYNLSGGRRNSRTGMVID